MVATHDTLPRRAAGPAPAPPARGRIADPVPSQGDVIVRGLPEVLRCGDAGLRARIVGGLQQRAGNAAVQRLVAGRAGPMAIQRWAVTVDAAETDCVRVANWITAHSPYRTAGGWAQTSATFSHSGQPSFSGTAPNLTVTIADPGVDMTLSVDMPAWSPTNAGMQRAWQTASSTLRAHEAQHEAIAQRWRSTLRQRWSGLSLSAATQAAGRAAVAAAWSGWLGEFRTDMRSIDPFSVVLDCSEEESSESETSLSEETTGGSEGEIAEEVASEVASEYEPETGGEGPTEEATEPEEYASASEEAPEEEEAAA